MALAQSDYQAHLQALQPRGPAWARDGSDSFGRQLAAYADELARLDARSGQLIEEADPRTTSEMLLDWERVAGLPDGCVSDAGISQTLSQRRAALLTRLTMIGGQSITYYIALAATLGYAITITEFHLHDVTDDVNYPLYATPWQFAWQINAALNTVVELLVIDSVDDQLAAWSNVALECVINRFKPAHTVPIFSYT